VNHAVAVAENELQTVARVNICMKLVERPNPCG
jgi:hypothetical protein